MKQLFACFLLMVFVFATLPVREIGKLLVKGQMTEEVQDHDDCGEDADCMKVLKEQDLYVHHVYASHTLPQQIYTQKVATAIHCAEALPEHFVSRVQTPPPDRA